MKPILIAAALAIPLSQAPAQIQNLAPVDGEVFPEIAFPTLDGKEILTLSAFRGKRVLLMQFASW